VDKTIEEFLNKKAIVSGTAVKENIDSIIDELGLEDTILYVEELIKNKEEYFNMSQNIFNGTYDFMNLPQVYTEHPVF
jgi:hypothetical protein